MKKQTTKSAPVRTLAADALAQVRGGSLNAYIDQVQGQKQGQFKGG